jgi:hypothetical protein
MIKHFVYVSHGWGKQLELVVSLNYDATASFWVNK